MDRKQLLSDVKRVVVKVGTANLTGKDYLIDEARIAGIVDQIMSLKKDNGLEIILVSSGAIGAGCGKLGFKTKPREISQLQACAAVGQNILISRYEKNFKKHKQLVSQILLTYDDFTNRKRYLNIRNTLNSLLELGVIPIINENDTVAVDEIKLGDNDNLSALVACNLQADLLIMLSDIDGLYTYDPRKSRDCKLISEVEKIDEKIMKCAGKARSGFGGMVTKINAGRITSASGIPMVIVNGKEKEVLAKIMEGEQLGTIFLPSKKMAGKDHWLLFTSTSQGKISVDSGAFKAIVEKGASLLPSGITKIDGDFEVGDTVSLIDEKKIEFAKGIVNFKREDAKKIMGRQTKEIEEILGRREYKEVIYSGNIVFTGK